MLRRVVEAGQQRGLSALHVDSCGVARQRVAVLTAVERHMVQSAPLGAEQPRRSAAGAARKHGRPRACAWLPRRHQALQLRQPRSVTSHALRQARRGSACQCSTRLARGFLQGRRCLGLGQRIGSQREGRLAATGRHPSGQAARAGPRRCWIAWQHSRPGLLGLAARLALTALGQRRRWRSRAW